MSFLYFSNQLIINQIILEDIFFSQALSAMSFLTFVCQIVTCFIARVPIAKVRGINQAIT